MRKCACCVIVVCVTTAAGAALPYEAAAQNLSNQPVEAVSQQQETAADVPDLSDLINGTVADFRRLPSRETFSIVTLGAVSAAFGHKYDRQVSHAMAASTDLDGVLDAGETIGGARTQLAGAVATYALGRLFGSPTTTTIGADLIRAQIVTQTMTAAIKLSVGRGRPDGTHYSFPSGHSSVTFASATVLQRHLGWKVGAPAYGVAAYVAASRVQDKRHFLSDVMLGAALGIAAGRTVTIGRGDARFAVAPAPAPGGAAVNLTWLGK